jgi:hypothetical protein
VYPVASQGSIVDTIERFQTAVMPAVRKELERS